jgi:glutathione synthase/RimK-type ligase-like ATP-grasp enzyme
VAGVYYLQRYVPTGVEAFRDYRLFVCAGEVVAGMTRHAPVWITNVRQGGRPEALPPDGELAGLALRAAESVGADYAGVDILRDAEGRPWVLEVNSMPGWKGLQQVAPVSIADHLAAAMAAALR